MANFITSDTHFYHDNILKFESMRRFRSDLYPTVESMNESMIQSWNSVVAPDDTVFHLGDFALVHRKGAYKAIDELLERLNGQIILVEGNHDYGFVVEVFKRHGHEVVQYYELTVDKQLICMSHYPFVTWNKAKYGSIMLHGHTHGAYSVAPGRIQDVGWDVHGRLLDLNDVIATCNAREIVSLYHP